MSEQDSKLRRRHYPGNGAADKRSARDVNSRPQSAELDVSESVPVVESIHEAVTHPLTIAVAPNESNETGSSGDSRNEVPATCRRENDPISNHRLFPVGSVCFSPRNFINWICSLARTFLLLLSKVPVFFASLFFPQPLPSFKEIFEMKYGDVHPLCYGASIREALASSRASGRNLVVYVHELNNPVADGVCRSVLTDGLVIELLNENCIFLGCLSTTYDAMQVLEVAHIQQLPCMLFFVPRDSSRIEDVYSHPHTPDTRWRRTASRMVQGILQGRFDQAACVAQVLRAHEVRESTERILKKQHEARAADRRIREEQEAAFEEVKRQESLRLQQENVEREIQQQKWVGQKHEQRNQHDERRRRHEERRRKEVLVRQRSEHRVRMAATFIEKDKAAQEVCAKDRTTVCLRLPNGSRFSRLFCRWDSVEDVYEWADCIAAYSKRPDVEIPLNFDLVVPPKRDLEKVGSLEGAGLHPNSVVMLIPVEND